DGVEHLIERLADLGLQEAALLFRRRAGARTGAGVEETVRADGQAVDRGEGQRVGAAPVVHVTERATALHAGRAEALHRAEDTGRVAAARPARIVGHADDEATVLEALDEALRTGRRVTGERTGRPVALPRVLAEDGRRDGAHETGAVEAGARSGRTGPLVRLAVLSARGLVAPEQLLHPRLGHVHRATPVELRQRDAGRLELVEQTLRVHVAVALGLHRCAIPVEVVAAQLLDQLPVVPGERNAALDHVSDGVDDVVAARLAHVGD